MPPSEPALRLELLRWMAEDQQIRHAISKPATESDLAALSEIDRRTTAYLRSVIETHGWPGNRLVGSDGATAAWLIAQHADADLAFQRRCLALLEQAVASGDAAPDLLAYLHDRVAVAEGRPQRYGTQFRDREPQPIEDEANVDARRAAMGLGTMAEYRREMARLTS